MKFEVVLIVKWKVSLDYFALLDVVYNSGIHLNMNICFL